MGRAVTWTPARIAELRSLAESGKDSHQIAAAFGLSRGRILSRASSLGIPIGRRGGARHDATPPKPHSPRFNPVIRRLPSAEPAPPPKMERRTAAARAPIPASKNLTLLDLTDATCKFETHGGTVEQYRFCGHPTEADEPYCLGHCWLAYNAPSRTAGTRKAAA